MAVVRLRGPLKQMAGERGLLRRHINVFVNGELGEQDTPVGAEDRIDVLPALSGGR